MLSVFATNPRMFTWHNAAKFPLSARGPQEERPLHCDGFSISRLSPSHGLFVESE